MRNPPVVDPLAADGAASGEDATERSIEQALAGSGSSTGLVLAFPSGLEPTRVVAGFAEAASDCTVVGMSGNGSIGAAGPIDEGCAALAFAEDTAFGIGTVEGAGIDLGAAAGRATAEAIRSLDGEPTAVLLFLDTRSGDQAAAIGGAYAAAGRRVPLVGGGAGGADPCQFVGGRALRDAVVAVALDCEVGIGEADGCRAEAVPAIVTRSEGRALLELDGRPAAEVYLERLGYNGVGPTDEFEEVAVTHPLAQPELDGSRRLRHVLGRGRGGSLLCATHIPVDAAVEFTHQPPEEIITASGRAVRASLDDLDRPEPRAALIFDCAGRKRAVGEGLGAEVAGLLAGFGERPPPVAGLFSHGEVCRLRGAKGDRNHAVVVASLS